MPSAEYLRLSRAAHAQAWRSGPLRAEYLAKARDRARIYRAARPEKRHAYVESGRKRAAAARSKYGPFAEAAMLLWDLEKEIRTREPSQYERAKARGYFDRSDMRKRNADA